jgi:hypothetical protein
MRKEATAASVCCMLIVEASTPSNIYPDNKEREKYWGRKSPHIHTKAIHSVPV